MGLDIDWARVWAKAKKVFVDQFLLISYFVAALIALTWPTPGKWVVGLEVRGRGAAAASASLRPCASRLAARAAALRLLPPTPLLCWGAA